MTSSTPKPVAKPSSTPKPDPAPDKPAPKRNVVLIVGLVLIGLIAAYAAVMGTLAYTSHHDAASANPTAPQSFYTGTTSTTPVGATLTKYACASDLKSVNLPAGANVKTITFSGGSASTVINPDTNFDSGNLTLKINLDPGTTVQGTIIHFSVGSADTYNSGGLSDALDQKIYTSTKTTVTYVAVKYLEFPFLDGFSSVTLCVK